MKYCLQVVTLVLASVGVCRADGLPTLRVFPAKVELNGQGDRLSVVVQEVDAQGLTKDVTAAAKFQLADAGVATLTDGRLAPGKDGTTKLVVEHGKLKAEAEVVVKNAAKSRAVSFRLDVMPVFMKHGCNNGSCHGAARGKDGFMLSLFGYDPAGDYYRLTRAIVGRRVDLASPEKSLLLEKTTNAVPHTGGKLFDTNHDDYKTLLGWLKAGAPDDGTDTPVPVGIELLPPKVVFPGTNATQKTVVLAKYSDGAVRDVTRLALYLTNNDAVAGIDKDGVAKANGRGGAFVFARFSKFTVGSEVLVLPTDDKFVWPKTPEKNYVDTLVFDKLKKLHMAPSELCSDEAFLRRVSLDLIGLPPTREEFEKFLADKAPDKRAKLIDTLIERPEFVDMWTMKWGELLRIRAANNNPQYGRDAKAMYTYAAWVKEQIAANRPLNEFVADLIAGTGSNFKQPTANLYTSAERLTPEKTAEDIAQVFLGTRIQCAQCHNHPFDRWTLDDYYGFSAFFAGVNLKRGVEGREVIVTNNNSANTVAHPVDGRRMKPKFLGGDVPEVEGQDPRKALATWLTSPDNAAFSKTMANMIWSHFFGRGITDPVDDVRISNPPSNKELLDELGTKLTAYKFDMKKLVKDICNSRTYQLSVTTNPTNELDSAYFSHAYVRRLRAEVLLDSITRITGTEDRFPLSPPGTRAVQIHTGEVSNYFLTTFGRAPRETPCSCEVSKAANLSQALHLVNGDTLTNKIAQSKVIADLVTKKAKPEDVIEELYIRAFSRKPNGDETKRLLDIVNKEIGNPDRVKELVAMRAGLDPTLARQQERLQKLKEDAKKLTGKDLAVAEKQIKNLGETVATTQKQYETAAAVTLYGDILWSLFNSTEFTFNH
ncbi:DUF1549 and DUF1553 domain-containing protein [Limnoglobus roseus]|uniref:DUF1549 domain-containing protein n=1 Tax=Limnoglobus roseus TaxID=2598579 RepID=A0A5C1A8K3_9BACT|nr:DUF1549 and DUF1553 domain-containing protein [Limnoglobus roseus]QEL13418.1 hypothetical protein PX52LOC_00273 [Limnoglobus roseus]